MTPAQAEKIQDSIFPLQMAAWRLLRQPSAPQRDEAIINAFVQILEAAEALRTFYAGTTSHYVDHEVFFPILARCHDQLAGRRIVDRLIILRGENTPKWIEACWRKACRASQLPDRPPTEFQLQVREFQCLLDRALEMIAAWGVRSDALIDAKVSLHPNSSAEQAGDALIRLFHFILDESNKPSPRITNYDATESLLNEIAKTLHSSGIYRMDDKQRWRKT